ncbi:MAG TPA: hypothetical protein VL461_11760 [Dictyobacter sp.]|nr:hypothetical protein [Dictyobacter sp.]
MAGSWDRHMKHLVGEAPQDFVQWLVQGAKYEREVSPHLSNRSIDADILYEISIEDQSYLLHIEFQKRSDSDMARRLWEYNVYATCKFAKPVYSFVIYLQADKQVAISPYVWKVHRDLEIHRFQFGVIKLWEIPTQNFIDMGLRGLLPLLPLTHEGMRHEVVDAAIAGLSSSDEKPAPELLALTYSIAALVFQQVEDQDWLRRRFSMFEDILTDSWAFKEMSQKAWDKGLQRGMEAGMQKGMEAGMQKGRLEGIRLVIMDIAQARFPALVPFIQNKCKQMDTLEQLQDCIRSVSTAVSEEELRQKLLL